MNAHDADWQLWETELATCAHLDTASTRVFDLRLCSDCNHYVDPRTWQAMPRDERGELSRD